MFNPAEVANQLAAKAAADKKAADEKKKKAATPPAVTPNLARTNPAYNYNNAPISAPRPVPKPPARKPSAAEQFAERQELTNVIVLPDKRVITQSQLNQLPERYQDIAKKQGYAAVMRQSGADAAALEMLKGKYEQEARNQQAAMDRLKLVATDKGPVQTNPVTGLTRGGTSYDIAKYLRQGGNDKTLRTAGFSNEAISDAKQFNTDNYGTGLKADGKNTPRISREQFMENLVVDEVGTGELPGINDPDRDRKLSVIQKAQDRASAKYRDIYGEKNVVLSNIGAVSEFLVAPPMRAIRPEVKLKDISGVEWALTAVVVAAIAIPAVRGVAAGVRAGKPLSKAVKTVAITEVKAAFTPSYAVLDDPVRIGGGTLGDIAETAVRPGKLPIEALEIREHTVRIPVKATKMGQKGTKKLQDAVTTKVIQNGKAISTVNGRQLELSRTALNRTTPAVVHASPDIRPFMQGAKVTAGREGGLFVAPNLHTRFTSASAFGDIPESGVRGALIIRDEKILAKLKSSKKIYAGTAEVEKVIPGGVDLPKPSQILITRDMHGNKITLLVFGKRFSQHEIAQMKIMGAADTVRQIFTPAYKLTKAKSGVAMNKLAKLNNEAKAIKSKLTIAKKEGNKAKIKQLNRELKRTTKDARRLADKIDANYKPGRVDPVLVNVGRKYLATISNRRGSGGEIENRASQSSRVLSGRAVTDIRSQTSRGVSTDQRASESARASQSEARADTRTTVDDSRIDARTPATDRVDSDTLRNDTPRTESGSINRVDNRQPATSFTNPQAQRGELPDLATKAPASKRTPEDYATAVTWKQGIGYWTVFPDKSTEFSMTKPDGVKVVAGPDRNKPGATIQVRNARLGAKVTTFDADMGIQDIAVRKQSGKQSGKILGIKFKQDRKQRTTNRVNLKLHDKSQKRGKVYYTKVSNGQLMSRRAL